MCGCSPAAQMADSWKPDLPEDGDPRFHLFHRDETGVSSRLYRLVTGMRVALRPLDMKACQEAAQRLYPKDPDANLRLKILMRIWNDAGRSERTNGLKLALESSDTSAIRYIRTHAFHPAIRGLGYFPETQLEKSEQALKTAAAISKRNPVSKKLEKQWSIGSDASDTHSFVEPLPNEGADTAQTDMSKDRQQSAPTLRYRLPKR